MLHASIYIYIYVICVYIYICCVNVICIYIYIYICYMYIYINLYVLCVYIYNCMCMLYVFIYIYINYMFVTYIYICLFIYMIFVRSRLTITKSDKCPNIIFGMSPSRFTGIILIPYERLVLKVSRFRVSQSRRKRDELVRMAADIFVQTGKKAGNLERRKSSKYSAESPLGSSCLDAIVTDSLDDDLSPWAPLHPRNKPCAPPSPRWWAFEGRVWWFAALGGCRVCPGPVGAFRSEAMVAAGSRNRMKAMDYADWKHWKPTICPTFWHFGSKQLETRSYGFWIHRFHRCFKYRLPCPVANGKAGCLRTHRIRSGNGITAALEVTGSLFLVQPRRQNPHFGTTNTWRWHVSSPRSTQESGSGHQATWRFDLKAGFALESMNGGLWQLCEVQVQGSWNMYSKRMWSRFRA